MSTYYYSKNAITHLLSFAKLANEYYIICNTRVDDAIYTQSKADRKSLQFQRNHKFNLYYMDISEADVNNHCYLSTVKQGKTLFSILDQKKAEIVRIIRERCVFTLDEDFINTLGYDSIEG